MHRKVTWRIVPVLVWGTLMAGAPARLSAVPGPDPEGAAATAPASAATGPALVAIELQCAARIDRDGLLRMLPVHAGAPFESDTAQQVRERLLQTELFSAVTTDVEPRGAGVALLVHLVRKAIINSLKFRGNHAIGDYDLQRVARLHETAVLTDEMRDAAMSRLRERYAAEGFEAANVTIDVCPRSPGEVDVVVQIDEGPPLVIEAVELAGVLPLPEADVRSAARIEAGDRFTRAKQRQAQTAIAKLFRERRYYEVEVSSAWERNAAHAGILRFTIASGPLFAVRFTGNEHFGDAKLLALMDLPARPIVTDGTWRALARRAQRAYQEDGYAFAKVEVRIEQGTPKAVAFTVQEGERYRIAAVRFEGNHGVPASQLLAQMGTRPPSWIPWRRGVFLDDVFDDDLKRLWYYYRRQGFESAEIVDAQTRFEADSGKLFVTVFIEEGPRTIVRQVVLEGTDAIHKLPKLQVAVSQPLDPDAVDTDRRALVDAFATEGYTDAAVKTAVSTAPGGDPLAATVQFTAQPGEQHRVGAIIVQDNFDTHVRVITRELPFKSGDPFDPAALLQGQGNIYRLGLFRSVTVRALERATDTAATDVGVNVSEKPPGTLQFGGGYNTRDGIRGFTEVGYSNLQGLGRRISLRGEFGFDPGSASFNDYIGNLGFREPRLDSTLWTFRANLLAQRSTQSIDEFSLERYALIPAIERTLSPGFTIGSEVQFEHSNVFDVKPDVLAFNPSDEGELWTVSLGPFAIYDGRDDAFVPRRGVFDSIRIKYAPGSLGSGVPFIKVVGEHSHYIPVFDNLTFVYAFRGGYAYAYEGGDQLP